jgi:hypothetical protein
MRIRYVLDHKQLEEKFVGSRRERHVVSYCCNIHYFEIILTGLSVSLLRKNKKKNCFGI